METNILFLTNSVRDYIKNLFEKKNITTLAITFTLYQEINDFINKIKNFEITNKKNTLKNLFLHNTCSDKYNMDQKTEKINLFIKSLNELNNTIDTPIKIINNDILDIIKNTNDKNDCKNKINTLVNNYFESSDIKKIEIIEHNIIKEELSKSSTEDKLLFMHFFEYIKCTDIKCEKYEITNENDPDGLLSLKKDNKNNIILLDLFKGTNVQINIKVEQELILKKQKTEIKSLFDTEVKKTCEKYANLFIKENFKNGKLIKNIKGGAGDFDDINTHATLFVFEAIINILTKIWEKAVNNIPALKLLCDISVIFASNAISFITNMGYFAYFCIMISMMAFYLYKYCNYLIDAYKTGELSVLLKKFFRKITILAITEIFKSIINNIRTMPGYTQRYDSQGNSFFVNRTMNGGSFKIIHSGGIGCDYKCYIIPDLKINIVNNFLLEINSSDIEFKECEKNKRIDIGNNNYIMSDDKIIYCYHTNIVNKIDCLTKTNLIRNNKINNMENMWDNFNEDLKKPITKHYKIIKKV